MMRSAGHPSGLSELSDSRKPPPFAGAAFLLRPNHKNGRLRAYSKLRRAMRSIIVPAVSRTSSTTTTPQRLLDAPHRIQRVVIQEDQKFQNHSKRPWHVGCNGRWQMAARANRGRTLCVRGDAARMHYRANLKRRSGTARLKSETAPIDMVVATTGKGGRKTESKGAAAAAGDTSGRED